MDERVVPGQLMWKPSGDLLTSSGMARFLAKVGRDEGKDLSEYADAHAWSVKEPDRFWGAVIDWFDLPIAPAAQRVLESAGMPGARWLTGHTMNYAAQVLRWSGPDAAIVARSQTRDDVTVSRDELRSLVIQASAGLRSLGVKKGDRVVAYMPNIPETIVAFLACASIGAIWSSCPPEFGSKAVLDRISQINPKVLLVVDGYRYGTKEFDRCGEISAIRRGLPNLEICILLPYLAPGRSNEGIPDALTWDCVMIESRPATASGSSEPELEPLPFDHPLFILFSSGTTGLPKAIVHGHGGIMLEHTKVLGLHHDLGPGDVFFWLTTTGWMMWNYLVSGLSVGSTVVLFDGDPASPDLMTLWRLADETAVDVFGVSAPYLLACRREGLTPRSELRLNHLRSIGSTGSPLASEEFGWVYEQVKQDVLLSSLSGGSDVCTAFVAGSPILPVHAGEISGPCLGCDIVAFDEAGNSIIGERGELVIRQPMPSMPVGFWGDPTGGRYRDTYFDRFPGIWRHGDWLEVTDRGSLIISGRSDATLNRGGVRMGTVEFYSIVEDMTSIRDALIVHCDGGPVATDRLILFVVLVEGVRLDDALIGHVRQEIRTRLSPRHVPDEVHSIASVPRTVSGKKMEVPVKRILEGEPADRVVNLGSMANPDSIAQFVALATRRP